MSESGAMMMLQTNKKKKKKEMENWGTKIPEHSS